MYIHVCSSQWQDSRTANILYVLTAGCLNYNCCQCSVDDMWTVCMRAAVLTGTSCRASVYVGEPIKCLDELNNQNKEWEWVDVTADNKPVPSEWARHMYTHHAGTVRVGDVYYVHVLLSASPIDCDTTQTISSQTFCVCLHFKSNKFCRNAAWIWISYLFTFNLLC